MTVEAGPDLSYVSGKYALVKLRKKLGLIAGISCQFNFKNHWSLRGILSYEKQGFRGPETIGVEDSLTGASFGLVSPFINWNYLKMPVLIQYTLGKSIKYQFGIGPYFAYLLNHKDKIRGENIKTMVVYKERGDISTIDAGVTFNLGILYPIKPKFSCFINVRYDWGLYNILRPGTANSISIKNRSIGLLLGMQYSLK